MGSCVSRAYLIKDHLPTHYLGNSQRMAAATLGGEKVHRGGGKRIIFKKEHNLTFLSTTHSTPPPHSLVFPPTRSSILLFFLSLSPHCSYTNHTCHTFPSLCPKLGHQLNTTLGRRAALQARGVTAELRGENKAS